MQLTSKSLLKLCRTMDLYSCPELNDKLYLHHKGIDKIQNLEAYIGLKVLFLQTNCISKIENLDNQTQLRCLHLQQNLIEDIGDGCEHMTQLHTLNLESNLIRTLTSDATIHTLKQLKILNTLNLSHNRIHNVMDLSALYVCPSISVLDLRNNQLRINDSKSESELAYFLNDILAKLPNLRVLYLCKNEICGQIPNYRKCIIHTCPQLKYLDDRPIFEDERRCCEAFYRGGIECERNERQIMRTEKREKHNRNHELFLKMMSDAKQAAQQLQQSDSSETLNSGETNCSSIKSEDEIEIEINSGLSSKENEISIDYSFINEDNDDQKSDN